MISMTQTIVCITCSPRNVAIAAIHVCLHCCLYF